MKSKTTKILWKVFSVLLAAGSIVVTALLDEGITSIGLSFSVLNPYYIMLAVLSLLVYWFADGWTLWYGLRMFGCKVKYISMVRIALVGLFGSAITPLASGGQPFQIYQLSRQGVKGAYSTSALLYKFVAFQLMLTVINIAALAVNYSELFSKNRIIITLTLMGLLYSSILMGVVLLLAINRKIVAWLIKAAIWIIRKLRLNKDPDALQEKLMAAVGQYIECLGYIKQHPWHMLWMCVVHLLQIFALFFITYCIYRALGLSGDGVFTIVSLHAFLFNSVSFIPLPGASGVSEGGFYVFFGGVFPQEYRFSAMLLWRLFTHYSGMIAGGIAIFFAKKAAALPIEEGQAVQAD